MLVLDFFRLHLDFKCDIYLKLIFLTYMLQQNMELFAVIFYIFLFKTKVIQKLISICYPVHESLSVTFVRYLSVVPEH